MVRIRRYDNEFAANEAAAYLRRNGVNARVVNSHISSTLGVGMLKFAQVHLVIPHEAFRERAESLLAEFEVEPAGPEAEWEQPRPRLDSLDAEQYAVACPSCEALLPLDASVEACPACGAWVDVVDLVVAAHGPDAIADCYESEPEPGDESLPKIAFCRECRYNLTGLPSRGRCPECGALYDTDEINRMS